MLDGNLAAGLRTNGNRRPWLVRLTIFFFKKRRNQKRYRTKDNVEEVEREAATPDHALIYQKASKRPSDKVVV
jgi:hypothetical protein